MCDAYRIFSRGLKIPVQDNEGVNEAIRTIRRYEVRRLGREIISEVGDHVVEAFHAAVEAVGQAVKRVTKISLAMDWLTAMLTENRQVAQRGVEEQGKKAGHTLKNLRIAQHRIGAKTFRKAGRWWWALMPAAKVDG